jgi:serine/threonine protein phosphatase PrpC
MSDLSVLHIVAAVVLAGLVIWAIIVRIVAKDAPDESPDESNGGGQGPSAGPGNGRASGSGAGATPDLTPGPSMVEVLAPSERAVAIAGQSAPVVILPVMRSRLDSHTEIRDDAADGLAVEVPRDEAKPSESLPSDTSRDSVVPSGGPQLMLISAIGRSEPAHGPTEMSAIVDRHRLFVLADGGGQRVQHELVSAVLVDALAAAFGADSDAVFAVDPALPRRADRLRRAVLAAGATLKARSKDDPIELSRVGVLAAHFAPDNRSLFIATAGSDRAYRLRGKEVVQLNKPSIVSQDVDGDRVVEMLVLDTAPEDIYVFGSDAAFLALGDELRTVLTFDRSIERVAAHFVAAATRGGRSAGMTAIVVRVESPRPSMPAPSA